MKRVVLLSVTMFVTACNPFGCREREERYFTELTILKEGTTEITFNRKLSECVNGIESDDFAWQSVQVEEPKFGGVALRPVRSEYPPAYAAQEQLDIGKKAFSFRANGISYIADLSSTEHTAQGTIRIQMKPFPPK
jgi:hypothetical protein